MNKPDYVAAVDAAIDRNCQEMDRSQKPRGTRASKGSGAFSVGRLDEVLERRAALEDEKETV